MGKKKSNRPSRAATNPPARPPRQWQILNREIRECTRCERLIGHCQNIGVKKKRAFIDDDYWAGPVENFGYSAQQMLVVGLAPAAHGANRTGRMFTGDRSGDWLFRALHRAGFCTQAESAHRRDGLKLVNCAITSVCHCAPPDNKPTRQEIENCSDFLSRTIQQSNPKVFLVLGKIAYDALVRFAIEQDWISAPRPKFGHGKLVELEKSRWLLASYHPSQQNTFTGRLTEAMLDEIMETAKTLCNQQNHD